MAISAADVKKLREKTGAGMMDCKNALQEAGGDFAKAERILKELGKAAAAKRSGRATNEGRIFVRVSGDTAALLELACETDFVARNETFVELGNKLVEDVLVRSLDEPDDQIHQEVADAISTIKENLSVRRISRMTKGSDEIFSSYTHGDTSRMGGVVRLKIGDATAMDNQAIKDFAFDCALHVVAFRPTYISADDVDPAYRKENEEIFLTQAKNLGKPEKVLQGIVQGKLKKHLSEICFLEQGFVKDEKTSVGSVANQVAKEANTSVELTGFRVFAVGEAQD